VGFVPDAGQARVIGLDRGALLVTGEAGTGKTTALEERFVHLLGSGADPERIALVVGSGGARDRGRRRLLRRLRTSLPSLRVLTVHGLAYHVLSQRFAALGYAEPPEVLPAADQFARVHELLLGEDPGSWPAYGAMLGLRGFADQVRQFLIRAQESLLSPDDVARSAERAGLTGWQELAVFYRRYRDVLDGAGLVDFAGLVMQASLAAAEGDPVMDHLLVDDYQDGTLAAEALVLAVRAESLVVAGDPGAHVFSFRGTTDVPIRNFTEHARGAEHVVLRERHRGRAGLEAWTSAHVSEEHGAIARELRRTHVEDGAPWGRLAIVIRRQGAEAAGLLRALDDAGVPRWMPEEGLGLGVEPSVAPFVLALRWLVRPRDREGLVESVLTSELARLSPADARGLLRTVRSQGLPADAALACRDGLSPVECESLDALQRALDSAGDVASRSVLDAFRALWTELGYARRLVEETDQSETGSRDLDAVVAFAGAVERAGESADPGTEAFLEQLEAGREGPGRAPQGEDPDAVHVITAHGAVGLEFDTVFVAGAVEGDFPSGTASGSRTSAACSEPSSAGPRGG